MADGDETRKLGGAPTRPIGRWIGLGVGAGIGSAAVAAALIYTNRQRKAKPPRGPRDEPE